MLFRAKEDFFVDMLDENGFIEVENGFCVDKGSLWYVEECDIETFKHGGVVYLYEVNSSRYLTEIDLNYAESLFELQ